MKSLIRYVPDDVIIDLAAPDLGAAVYMLLERHYRQSKRASYPFHRANPAFECLEHQDGSNPGLHLKKVGGQLFAAHYVGGKCGTIRIPAPMSDEHKRQAEYWARAAQDAGYRAELECMLETGTKPDVLIYGPVTTGIEVQRSPMTASSAVIRTQRAALASVTDIWFSGSASATLAPKWAWRVPTVLSRELGVRGEGQSWDATPPRRSVQAAGLRILRPAKCTVVQFDRCPEGHAHCGKYHAKPEAWRGLSVDDIAGMFPAGQIVPLRFWGVRPLGSRHRDAVLLVPPSSAELYTEITGRTGAVSFSPRKEDKAPRVPSPRAPCQNDQPAATARAGVAVLPPSPLNQPQITNCVICALPLDPALAEAGEATHPVCDPDGLAARWPARSTGTCAACDQQIRVGQAIRQFPGYAGRNAGPVFGHDTCVLQLDHGLR